MNEVLDMKYGSFVTVDARFKYEYEGGHIPNAININNAVDTTLLRKWKRGILPSTIIVFHCEFSRQRGPTM